MEMLEIAYEESCPTTKIRFAALLSVSASKWREHERGNKNVTEELRREGRKQLEFYFKAIDNIQMGMKILVTEDEVDCSEWALYDINA